MSKQYLNVMSGEYCTSVPADESNAFILDQLLFAPSSQPAVVQAQQLMSDGTDALNTYKQLVSLRDKQIKQMNAAEQLARFVGNEMLALQRILQLRSDMFRPEEAKWKRISNEDIQAVIQKLKSTMVDPKVIRAATHPHQHSSNNNAPRAPIALVDLLPIKSEDDIMDTFLELSAVMEQWAKEIKDLELALASQQNRSQGLVQLPVNNSSFSRPSSPLDDQFKQSLNEKIIKLEPLQHLVERIQTIQRQLPQQQAMPAAGFGGLLQPENLADSAMGMIINQAQFGVVDQDYTSRRAQERLLSEECEDLEKNAIAGAQRLIETFNAFQIDFHAKVCVLVSVAQTLVPIREEQEHLLKQANERRGDVDLRLDQLHAFSVLPRSYVSCIEEVVRRVQWHEAFRKARADLQRMQESENTQRLDFFKGLFGDNSIASGYKTILHNILVSNLMPYLGRTNVIASISQPAQSIVSSARGFGEPSLPAVGSASDLMQGLDWQLAGDSIILSQTQPSSTAGSSSIAGTVLSPTGQPPSLPAVASASYFSVTTSATGTSTAVETTEEGEDDDGSELTDDSLSDEGMDDVGIDENLIKVHEEEIKRKDTEIAKLKMLLSSQMTQSMRTTDALSSPGSASSVDLSAALAEAQEQNKLLQQKLDESTSSQESLLASLKTKEEEMYVLTEELSASKETIEQLRVELAEQKASLSADLTSCRQEFDDMQSKYDVVLEELASTKKSLENEKQVQQALSANLEEAKVFGQQALQQRDSLSAEIQHFEIRVRDLQKNQDSLVSEISALGAKLSEGQREKRELQEQLEHVEAQFGDARTVIAKLQQEAALKRTQRDQEMQQVRLVKEELQKALFDAESKAQKSAQEAEQARRETKQQAIQIQTNFDAIIREMQEKHEKEMKQKIKEAVDKERTACELEIQKQRDTTVHLSSMLEEVQRSLDTANSEIEHRELALTRKIEELQRKLDEEKKKCQKYLEQQVKLLEVIDKDEKLKPNEIRVAIRDFKPNDIVFFMRRKHGNGTETWETLNQGAPHYFLSPQAAEQLARKIPAGSEVPFVRMQILYIEELTASQKLNPFRLAPGTVYRVVHPYPLDSSAPSGDSASSSSSSNSSNSSAAQRN